jgi:gluconate 5-dehydrogenase
LQGEIALVTGGGSGLGLAIARCMAAAGARVVLAGRREEVLDEAVVSIGSGALGIVHDVTRLDSLPQLVAQVEAQAGPLSILVNNAGVHLKKPALATSDQEFAELVQIHLFAAFALAREAATGMLARGKGSILFIASMASLFGIPEITAYSAVKSAVLGLTRTLAVEWSGAGVRVNAVVPGWIDVGMARITLERDPERKARILARTPLGRLGSPEDVGWASVYLCSPAASFVTGSALVVDGGAAVGF